LPFLGERDRVQASQGAPLLAVDDHRGVKGKRRRGKPFLLVQDEFRNMFAKSNIDNSALPYMLNDLFYHDEFETTNQKGSMACRPKLSIIGGLTCANAEEFADVFGKATTTGMYDRFIYGVAPTKRNWDDTWEKSVIPEKREPKSVTITDEAYGMKKAWIAENPEHRERKHDGLRRHGQANWSTTRTHSKVSTGARANPNLASDSGFLTAVVLSPVIAFESFRDVGEQPFDAVAQTGFLGRMGLRNTSCGTAQSAGVDFLDRIFFRFLNENGFEVHSVISTIEFTSQISA